MALTPSTMKLTLGAAAPDFSLPDPDGKSHSLAEFAGKPRPCGVLLQSLPLRQTRRPGVRPVGQGISGQRRGRGGDQLERLHRASGRFTGEDEDGNCQNRGYTFRYLVDETQETAKAYHAACTPDFFVFDKDHKLGLSRADGRQPARQQSAGDRQGPP